MKTQYVLAIGLMVLFGFSSLGQGKLSKSFEGIEKVEMSVGSGDIDINKSDDGTAYVEMEHNFSDDYNPIIEKRQNTLVIREERNRNNYRGSAYWTIDVPSGIEIKINTGSGDISVKELEVEGKMNSGSGDFLVENVNGEFDINTGSGDIVAESYKGEAELNTGSGNIKLADFEGEVSANTGSGNISAEKIVLLGSSGFNSGSGNSKVTLGAPIAYDLSVNSGSGDATVDFDGTPLVGTLEMEVNKQRGKIVAPFDFDTTEEIEGYGRNTKIRKTKKFDDKSVLVRISSGSGDATIEE